MGNGIYEGNAHPSFFILYAHEGDTTLTALQEMDTHLTPMKEAILLRVWRGKSNKMWEKTSSTLYKSERTWGTARKRKIAKTLYTKDLAIDSELNLVPRAGVEPARVAPLVFETSASTDSAIWA